MPYDQVMSKWKAGTLRSGGSGEPVKSRRQAIAIMLSEKKKAEEGDKEYQASGDEHPMKRAFGRPTHRR